VTEAIGRRGAQPLLLLSWERAMKTKIKFPRVKDVAAGLVAIKKATDFDWLDEVGDTDDDGNGYMDVRLQVHEDGGYSILTGDSSFDQDHRGYWGAGSMDRRTNCLDLARQLLDEARDDYASR
jgi:hypothetical protein